MSAPGYTIKIFEEFGPVVNGRGEVREVTNINFKNTIDPDRLYYEQESLIERKTGNYLNFSFTKYYFFEVYGEPYPDIKDVDIILRPEKTTGFEKSPATATGCKVFYGLTNIYNPNLITFDGELRYWNTTSTINLRTNTGPSPITAVSRPSLIPSSVGSFCTSYLKLQLHVPGDPDWTKVGNTPQYKIELRLKSFRTGY